MATGTSLSADEALRATEEKANFQRLTRLLIRGGLALLRELFDAIHPPANLPTVLGDATIKSKLETLRRNRVLTYPEWECLYNPPSGAYGKSSDFDITLLCKLLREICNLAPSTGWDNFPNSTDHSREADVVRIKFYRNTIYGHNQSMEITNTDFEKLWMEISEALLRIANSISSAKRDEWKKSIESFFHEPLTPDAQENVLQPRLWYKKEMETKDKVEELTEEVKQMKISRDQMLMYIHVLAENPDFWSVVCSFRDSFYKLFEYLKSTVGVRVEHSKMGSLIVTVSCSSLEVLEELWKEYRTGHLNEMVQATLVSAEVLEKLELSEVKLRTIISEEDYLSYKDFLKNRSAKVEEPSSLRATQVSHNRLTKLSKALGSNWRKLGNSLGVSEQQLEDINKRNKRKSDKGKDMLDEWKRTSGDAATLEALQEALKKAEMDDLLDVVAGTPVSYLLLGGLAESLDTNWIELGKILGFSKKNLQKVDMKNECLRDKGMAMLVGWKMRRGDDATVEVLQNALMELGMMDMLELDADTNYYHDT